MAMRGGLVAGERRGAARDADCLRCARWSMRGRCAACGLVAFALCAARVGAVRCTGCDAGAGGAMLLTMVLFGGWRGFKEWADGWAEGWVV